jgi:hypothetical protein
MLSLLPGISIKFKRNAFKVEKSKNVFGAVCKYFGLYVSFLVPSIFNSNPKSRRAGMTQCYACGLKYKQL